MSAVIPAPWELWSPYVSCRLQVLTQDERVSVHVHVCGSMPFCRGTLKSGPIIQMCRSRQQIVHICLIKLLFYTVRQVNLQMTSIFLCIKISLSSFRKWIYTELMSMINWGLLCATGPMMRMRQGYMSVRWVASWK